MNLETFLSFTPGWLLDVMLQMTVLLGVALCVTAGVRRMAAARRHFILASTLMMIPVMMGCSFIAPVWRMPMLWGAPSADEKAAGSLETTVALNYTQVPPAIESVVTVSVAGTAVPASPLWAVLWLGGVATGAVVLGCSGLALLRLRGESHPVVDAGIRRCFAEEAAALRLVLPADCLRMSAGCAVPMTWGISHKTVLLPVEAAEWPEARLRLVLRHELAHVAREDVRTTLLTTVAALLLWPHPLVWAVLRACGRAREQACDDVALERSGLGVGDFAKELLEAVAGLGSTARTWLPLALAMSVSVSANARAMRLRLASLVEAGRGREGFTRMQKAALLLPCAAGAFALAGLSACRKAETVPDAAVIEAAMKQQILVRSRFISIPKDSPVLAEAGLTLDGKLPVLQSLGIRTMEQTQELLRKVSQQTGVYLLSAPSVTTRSGQKATMEVVREFIYPTEFDPPKQATQNEPVIPTTPTKFEMKPVGVRLEVVPTLLEDGSIDLMATPEVTSFEGFMDYGAPITHEGKVVSENTIKQPIFHTMKSSAGFMIKPGQSVVFGGLGGPEASGVTKAGQNFRALDPDGALLTSRRPEAKDLVFFIIEASVVDSTGKVVEVRHEPVISLPEVASVVVYGQVKRQGAYELKPGMTVGDLLKEAQGLTDRADATRVELRRGPKDARRATVMDLPNGYVKALEAGDVVTVLER